MRKALWCLLWLGLGSHGFAATELPELGEVPAFEFTNQKGKRLGLEALRGRVWVASFLFTSCQGQCPVLASKLAGLQKKFAGPSGPRLVSFTVDPKTDTPEVLSAFGKRFGAKAGKWDFLTGPEGEIQNLMRTGFLLGGGGGDAISHSFRFVLVDARGVIRGFYPALDAERFKELETALTTLLESSGGLAF